MIAYCFTEIKGFSKFGFFRGNGSSDGQMILTGFRPAYLIVRRHDSGNNWRTFDATRSPFNTVDDRLYADTGNSESTGSDVDFVSNGFKMRQTDSGMNASGGKYIFIAFFGLRFVLSDKNKEARFETFLLMVLLLTITPSKSKRRQLSIILSYGLCI